MNDNIMDYFSTHMNGLFPLIFLLNGSEKHLELIMWLITEL